MNILTSYPNGHLTRLYSFAPTTAGPVQQRFAGSVSGAMDYSAMQSSSTPDSVQNISTPKKQQRKANGTGLEEHETSLTQAGEQGQQNSRPTGLLTDQMSCGGANRCTG